MVNDGNEVDGNPCQAEEFNQFDFWLGHWRVQWGEGEHGTNKVEKVLGDCVILEQFDGRPGTELVGKSLSTYVTARSCWQQTWVDNSGGYLDFEGGWQGDRMVLSRQVPGTDSAIWQRMIWFDIQPDSLTWNWERSEDGGKSWQLQWQLKYQRLKDH